MSEKIKYLEFIQQIIARMNSNSFHIKGWSVTIVSALLAVYASTKNTNLIVIGVFPTLIFWFMDAYYLTQERRFRGLYNDAANLSDEPKNTKLYAMRADLYVGGDYSYWSAFKSSTVATLYASIILVLVLLLMYLHCM